MVDVKSKPTNLPESDEWTAVGHRWAFSVFSILFMLTLIAGMVNYLGSILKFRVG
jgi:hypothetical protein